MGVYSDIEPCCPRFHRSTPKGPTATVLFYLRTQLPAYGLPEPTYGHNYYKLSLRERVKSKPEMQGLVDEVHDALRSYLLKITGIETASALIHLTAGVIQVISSSFALKKSSGFESALHVTSIIAGALSIIGAIIQGIAIPPLVKKTFDKVTKAVSDTVEVVTDFVNQDDITPRQGRKILNPLHLLATGASQQGLATTQPASPTTTQASASSVPVTATPAQTSIQPQPPVVPSSSPVVVSATPLVTTSTKTIEPTDNRVRQQIGVHHCTDSCKTIVVNAGSQKVKWYTPVDWEDTIRLLFSVQNSQYHNDIAQAFPDKKSLQHIGIEFFETEPTSVDGCTRNAVFVKDGSLGLTDDFNHRPIAPGYAYEKGKIKLLPWGLGLHNIRKGTDQKIYWDPDMEAAHPFVSVKFGKAKDVIQSLATLKRLTYDDASSQLNAASWVCNHTLDKGSIKNHPGPFFLTPTTAPVFAVKAYKGVIVFPYTTQSQSKQDWSKLIIGLITTTICAVGVGLSPGRADIMKWISGANQGAAMVKNASQAQDFIVNQLAGMETAADEELEKRYKDLCIEADNILAVPPGVFTTRVDLIEKYDAWNNAFDRFMRDAKSSKSKAVNWYVRTLQSKQSKLAELWVSINQCFHSSKKRTPTVLIELTGAPGIGKTTSIQNFIVPDLAKMMGDVSPECFHWQINHNGHVNVYGGEIFSSYDEYRARGSDDPMFQYLNHICSSPAFLIPSAFDKSRNFLSRVLFLTSNSGKTDLKDVMTTEAEKALNSRVKTYRLEHPRAEQLMKQLQTREVICDRSPETFKYYRRLTSSDQVGRARDVEVEISYKDFLIDIYTMMWQQHNTHPPMAVDDNVRDLLKNWTGVKEPAFSEAHRAGRTIPLANDVIPPLTKREPEKTINLAPVASQAQGSVEHFVVNIRGHSGRGKTHFMTEVEHLFPRLVHTSVRRIDLRDRNTWKQAFAYWIDDQIIANQDLYLDFYNQLSQPSVIFLTSNLKVRDKKEKLTESVRLWWTGAPKPRVVEQITVEGVKRRLGLKGVLLLSDDDTETVFSSTGTYIEAEIEKPGFVKIDNEVCSKDKFLVRLGDSIKNWREHELLYSWADDTSIELPVDPDICIKAKTWGSLKTMLTSGKTMWENLTYQRNSPNSDYLFVKSELAEKLQQKNEIVVDFWKLHPSVDVDQQDFSVEAIFATYRQVDSDSTLLLHIGEDTYWNRDQCLYKRGRTKETALYKDDGDSITVYFNSSGEVVHQITVPKTEYVQAVCEGFIYSPTLLHLSTARQDLLLRQSDYILGLPYMTPHVTKHLETVQVSWYAGVWAKAKRLLRQMWKEHPIFLVAGVLCAIWVGWKGLTSIYTTVKACITGITEWRCPCCSYLHAFTQQQRKCFLTADYKYCPNCRTKYAITHEGELLSVHRLCEQTRAWQDETFHQKTTREVKCPIAENQSPTSLSDKDAAWRSGKNGTMRTAKWQKGVKSNPNKYAPPLADAGIPSTFSDAWVENWEAPTDDWEFQGKQDHYHAVLRAVKQNMCTVSGSCTTKAMFLRDKYVIYPWHAHEDVGMSVKADGKHWDLVPVYGNSDADIAISKVVDKRFPARKDITKYMLPASQVDKIASGMIVIYDDHGYDSISGSLRFVQECHSHYFDTNNQKVSQNLLSLNAVSMSTGGLHPEVGDCGNPYIAMTGNAQCLVGYHISYSHHTATAYAAALIKENITDVLADYETRVFQAGEKNVTSFRVPFGQYYATDDFITYIDTIRPEDGNVVLPEPRCVVLGKGPKATFPRKNSMYKRTPFSNQILPKLPIAKIPVSGNMQQVKDFSNLHKNRKGQYCFMTTQMASCNSSFRADIKILEKAESIVTQMMHAYYGKDHRMLNQHETLNGIPGISPVTLDTGAGIICEKMHKVMLKRDAITFDGTYKFRENEKGNSVRARFKHDVEMFKQNKPPAYLFKAELKSECLPIDKAEKGKIRLFNNGSLELLLIERKMSGHIAASISEKPGPIFIGKDPLLHFNEYFKSLLFTHHLDIDVKRWDKSVLPAFIARSLRILGSMHADPDTMNWYTTLFMIIGYPLVQFDETLAQIAGTIPSGMYHTALLGSVCHMLICTYALLRSMPEGTNPLHGGYFLTCADDLSYLHDGKEIDLDVFTEAYRECGIEIQHPDKVGGQIRSAPSSDPILFCSRIIRKEDGRWFPALNWASLTSCLHFTKEKGQLGLENILSVVRCESYAMTRNEYEKLKSIMFDIYVFLQKADVAASLPEYSVAHLICRNFISGIIEDRAAMLAGSSSSLAVNKILTVDFSEPQGKPKCTVRIDKVPVFSRFHPGRMGTEHPRTRFLQSRGGSVRDFEEHVKATAGRFECTLTIAGKTYHGDGSSHAAAGRAAWDSYEHAQPVANVPISEDVVTIPASQLHPKTRCNTIFQKSGHARPTAYSFATKAGWTTNIEQDGNSTVRTGKDKKTSEFLAWDIYYIALCQKTGLRSELDEYLSTGYSRSKLPSISASVDPTSTSSTPQADAPGASIPHEPWTMGSFRGHFLNSSLYGASLKEVEASFLSYVMERYQPGAVPVFELQKLRTAITMSARRNFPIATEHELEILANMSVAKCDYELQLWAKLANELTDEDVSRLFHLHDTYSSPQGDNQYDMPPVPSSYLPLATTRGIAAPMVVPAMGVPISMLSYGGVSSDVIDIMNREIWSPCIPISPSDPAGTILLNVSWAENTNWGITQFLSLHKKAAGEIYVTVLISGANQCTGLLRGGLLMENLASPTVADLECAQNITLGLNGDQTMTFPLKFVSDSKFFMDTAAMPDFPRIVVIQESSISNMYGSTSPAAQMKYAYDASAREMSAEGKYVKNNAGLSLVVADCRPPTGTPTGSISSTGIAMKDIFAGKNFLNMCTDGRTSYDVNTIDMTKRPVLPANLNNHVPHVDTTGINFLQDYYDGTNKVSVIIRTHPSFGDVRVASGGSNFTDQQIMTATDGPGTTMFIHRGQSGVYTGRVRTTGVWPNSLTGIHTTLTEQELQDTATDKRIFAELNGSFGGDIVTYKQDVVLTSVGYNSDGSPVDISNTCNVNARYMYRNGCGFFTYQVSQAEISAFSSLGHMRAFQGPTENIATGDLPEVTTKAVTTSIERSAAALTLDLGAALPIALSTTRSGATSLPPQYAIVRFLDTVPALIQTANGQSFQASVHSEHVLKQWLIQHTNAKNGDILHFNIGRRGFAESIADIRMMVLGTVEASYLVVKASQQYSWFGGVLDTWIRNLVKVTSAALLPQTDQTGWQSMLVGGSLSENFKKEKSYSPQNIAALMAADPDFQALARRYTSSPQSGMTRREVCEVNLGRYFSVKDNQTTRRVETINKYLLYRTISEENKCLEREMRTPKLDVCLSHSAQELYRVMQAHLVAKHDIEHDPMIRNDALKSILVDSASTLIQQLGEISHKLDKLQDLIGLNSSLLKPVVRDAITQAGLSDGKEVVSQRPKGQRFTSTPQAEVAALAFSGMAQGIGGGVSKYFDRKFQQKMLAQTWENASEMQKLKGKQTLQQELLKGGLQYKSAQMLQQRNFANQIELTGMQGASRLAMSRQQGANQLNVERYKKTGSTAEPPGPTSDAGTTMHHDMGVGTAPKKQAPSPPTATASVDTGTDDLDHNYDYLVSNRMMTNAPSSAGSSETTVPLPSTSAEVDTEV